MTVCSDKSDVKKLFETVINNGYCVGCGACASVSGSPIQMKLDEYDRFKATLISSTNLSSQNVSVQTVCPFSEEEFNENRIGQEIFSKDCEYHDKIGYHLATYAGYVSKGDFRERGSSGGIGSWITTKLLSENLVDGIVHIHQRHPTTEDNRLFKYHLSLTVEDVRSGAKSRYYPVEMSEVIQIIRNRPGRYAIVGIPCFIKAIRLLIRQDDLLAERIKFCIGLVCGHLKSRAFAKMFAWQLGIEPNNIIAFDFRKKLPNADANKYGIEVTGIKEGKIITCTSPIQDLYGADWGLGFFKYKACDYCDDVVAETADISIGDAWLPQYVKDERGTNIVIVRNPILHQLIKQAIISGDLILEHIDAEKITRSQNSGFQHRRNGLAYRLHLADNKGEWRPMKRVKAQTSHLDSISQERFLIRTQLSERSHQAFEDAINAAQFSVFREKMAPLIERYRATYLPPKKPFWKRTLRNLKKNLTRLFKVTVRLKKI